MSEKVLSPMPAKVLAVQVKVGDRVEADSELLLIEAMKMEIPVAAPVKGTVKEINVVEGQSVKEGDILVVLE